MRHLITSALPYINGIKHLGNLAGSLLPADIHARHLRQTGAQVAFICATDEHGTPAELGAAAAEQDIRSYCDEQHLVQADIYRRFDLSFDHFGRTSSPTNHRLTQALFRSLDKRGYIEEREIDQIWSPADGRFLPDRYVEGTCPHCGGHARGDQCEVCSTTLDPTDLIGARSAISGAGGLELRPARHLFLRQSTLQGELQEWIEASTEWPAQVRGIAKGWLAQGLQDRCITRDLAWGVPVPKAGYEHLRFYVWFDAPIGYIAATTEWCLDRDKFISDWWGSFADVRYVQFLGKDNVPFHALTFPATTIGAGDVYNRVDLIKGVNWLSYEGGKFSTSARRGVFLDQALELLPSDSWRWWLAANCPETSDVDFDFVRFAADVNTDLADKFGNLVSRVLGFVAGRYGGSVPEGGAEGPAETALRHDVATALREIDDAHRKAEIRRAADRVRALWDIANAYVANEAPWTLAKTDPERASIVTRNAIALVRLSALVAEPFVPSSAREVLGLFGEHGQPRWPTADDDVLAVDPDLVFERPQPVFAKIPEEWAHEQRRRFAGTA